MGAHNLRQHRPPWLTAARWVGKFSDEVIVQVFANAVEVVAVHVATIQRQ